MQSHADCHGPKTRIAVQRVEGVRGQSPKRPQTVIGGGPTLGVKGFAIGFILQANLFVISRKTSAPHFQAAFLLHGKATISFQVCLRSRFPTIFFCSVNGDVSCGELESVILQGSIKFYIRPCCNHSLCHWPELKLFLSR